MSVSIPSGARVAIACGGTGGHLFPGLAVAAQLVERGCGVTLLISPKDVDQEGVRGTQGMEIVTLPAVGLKRGGRIAFLRGFYQSYRAARAMFKKQAPQIALAMGGFTSAPPILAAKRSGARTFLHESNTVPGRANRWLSPWVDEAFVGFPSAAAGLRARKVTVTGTPVRPEFKARAAGPCRAALGLNPERPVLLVMGGSQGAAGINELLIRSLPLLGQVVPELQYFHLAGPADAARAKQAYAASKMAAIVHPFFADMALALGAATMALSRSGASSLAELAVMRVPAVLVPYPAATDNHQVHNARAFEATGAARLLEQGAATPEWLAHLLIELVKSPSVREDARRALAQWDAPNAPGEIAETMLKAAGIAVGQTAGACRVPSSSQLADEAQDLRVPGPAEAAATGAAAVLRRRLQLCPAKE